MSGLSADAVEAVADRFARDGYAVVGPLADAAELDVLRDGYDALIEGRIDASRTDRHLGGITRQLMFPNLYSPLFAENPALAAARRVAGRILGMDDPKFYFSMLIDKPAGHPHTTPWHQDAAYFQMPATPGGFGFPSKLVIQFWMALDQVDETMGCMEFRPGVQNEPVRPHHVASGAPDDEGRLLGIDADAIDALPLAVAEPLAPGWATVHDYLTPHYTGPNRSERRRRAYIFSFRDEARWEAFRDLHPFDPSTGSRNPAFSSKIY